MNTNENNENILTILLVEDDKSACDEIEEYVDTCDNVCLVGITGNSNEALDIVKHHLHLHSILKQPCFHLETRTLSPAIYM